MLKMLEEMEITQQEVIRFTERTSEMSDLMWMSAVCMILEEGCKQRNLDVVDVAKDLHKVVAEVNESEGKY